jgi:magnesium chelatase family protein
VLRRDFPIRHGTGVIEDGLKRGVLSARGVDKVLRIAWTLADLAERDQPRRDDVYAALGLRQGKEIG